MKFRIGEYYEYYQNHMTDHREEVIGAKDLEEARKIADEKFGWGAWACEEKEENDSHEKR